jgi:hypothetical protein
MTKPIGNMPLSITVNGHTFVHIKACPCALMDHYRLTHAPHREIGLPPPSASERWSRSGVIAPFRMSIMTRHRMRDNNTALSRDSAVSRVRPLGHHTPPRQPHHTAVSRGFVTDTPAERCIQSAEAQRHTTAKPSGAAVTRDRSRGGHHTTVDGGTCL